MTTDVRTKPMTGANAARPPISQSRSRIRDGAPANSRRRGDGVFTRNCKSVVRDVAVCSRGWLLTLGFVVVFVLSSGPALSAQADRTSLPLPPVAQAHDGGQLFKDHCATCHGTGGRGDGPTSVALRKPPADLTKFALRNGGVFPSERLRRIIDGRDVPSHGDRAMPVWGISLRTSRDSGGYDSVEARINALVHYIQSIQERQGQ